MLKRMDNFTKNVFGSESFNKTWKKWKKSPLPKKMSFTGRVNIFYLSQEIMYADTQTADRNSL